MAKLKQIVAATALVGATVAAQPIQAQSYVQKDLVMTSDKMTPEVLWSFGRVGGADVSPDGKTVVYGVTHFNIEKNKSYRDLYTVPVKGGESVKLTDTEEKEFENHFRPDGKKIGYLSTKGGSVQMWEMNLDGSDKTQITNIEGGIDGFKYSPDVKHIFYIKTVKLDNTVQDLYPDLPLADARIEDDLMYRHWDHWADYTYNHVFVAPYGETITEGKDLLEGEKFHSPLKPFGGSEEIAWSVDGKTIAYTSKKKQGMESAFSTNSDIFFYDVASGTTKNITPNNMGYDKSPAFSPNGKYVAWESMERDGYEADKNRLFIMDLATGEQTDLTEGWDASIHGLVWTADSKSIYGISDIEATDEIYRVDIKSKKITRVTEGVHNYQTVIPVGKELIAQRVSMSAPAELYSVSAKNGEATAITAVTKPLMDKLTMGKVESRWIPTTDGKKEKVWVIYPPHFDPNKKYPALLYCQGGPQGTVSQFWSYRWNFQMMAANDYIIVAPNRHGLPGFGQEWCEQISKDYGGQCMDDYKSAIDAVAKEPFVDENRLGAVGASFGGYSVYYLAGNHDGRFKTFISHCGIFNFDQMYVTTEESFFVDWEFGGAPWDTDNAVAQKSYQQFSPHHYIKNWDTPMLVIHGAKDFRIPYTQGMGAFNAAKMKGLPARFLYFPEENHWVSSAQNGILWQRVFFDWLDRDLK